MNMGYFEMKKPEYKFVYTILNDLNYIWPQLCRKISWKEMLIVDISEQ